MYVTRGEGVKKSETFADVIYGSQSVGLLDVCLFFALLLSLQMGDFGGGMQMDCLAISAN